MSQHWKKEVLEIKIIKKREGQQSMYHFSSMILSWLVKSILSDTEIWECMGFLYRVSGILFHELMQQFLFESIPCITLIKRGICKRSALLNLVGLICTSYIFENVFKRFREFTFKEQTKIQFWISKMSSMLIFSIC